MSILMPNGKDWLASNWISHTFFRDSLPHLSKTPRLKIGIQFCVDAEVDTLDLRDKDIEVIRELKTLVSSVLKENLWSRGTNFYLPEYFPLYLTKLEELNILLDETLQTLS